MKPTAEELITMPTRLTSVYAAVVAALWRVLTWIADLRGHAVVVGVVRAPSAASGWARDRWVGWRARHRGRHCCHECRQRGGGVVPAGWVPVNARGVPMGAGVSVDPPGLADWMAEQKAQAAQDAAAAADAAVEAPTVVLTAYRPADPPVSELPTAAVLARPAAVVQDLAAVA